ncbi:MarR family transcriptional regulator [Flavobacterium sp. CBA20B-1]|uniref:MarR family winged helix-turn-helix transcriptional regulator n=1 Tax=unclassified Flavobacterium TaxID=196869 RepID=UPI0022250C66|nr:MULTISPECIES: helix-turn-helix domain-containing protein [unclassified Flavobacterium]WCM41495.1 MarR family transcriptional regulator [Flavobacterium sp. CBA20B-1]
MNYTLLRDVINLLEEFEKNGKHTKNDLSGFRDWLAGNIVGETSLEDVQWEGKEKGRSAESVINTLIVHLSRYAKTYSKAAIHNSEFSTQEDFIYLINLNAFGAMSKMQLIKKNIQDKPTGMQIINRLIDKGWVIQEDSEIDKRSKIIQISNKGKEALDAQMDKIRVASQIVTGNLDDNEKADLIRLLNKLDHFHQPIFQQNYDSSELLERVTEKYLSA